MRSIPQNKFQCFIDDPFFADWVRNPTPESNKYWEEYISQHPSEKEYFEQAIFIMTRFLKERNGPKDEDVRNVWSGIQAGVKNSPRKISYINVWSVAASIVLIIGIGILFRAIEKQDLTINYNSLAVKESEGNEVKLILSDNTEKRINAEDPSIKYNQNGEIMVDSVVLFSEFSAPGNKDMETFNQLIVSKGKRSGLTLSDGTVLYLNSGSQVIYTVIFNKKFREIYVRGEVYLKVAHNADCPFIVKADHLNIKVLCTEFNVRSYPDDSGSSVVLVKGSVQAILRSKKIMMEENELLTLDNSTERTTLERVDLLEYISWKDGWLYCTNERIESVAKKLSRYYDMEIQFNDPELKEITLTGKLDLKDEFSEVLDVVCLIAPVPVDYEILDGKITLSLKDR